MKKPFRLRFVIAFLVLSVGLFAFLDWKLFSTAKDDGGTQLSLVMKDIGDDGLNSITPSAGERPLPKIEFDNNWTPFEESAFAKDTVLNNDFEVFESEIAKSSASDTFDASSEEAIAHNESDEAQKSVSQPILYTSPPVNFNKPKIAIIIDDIGMDISGSKRAVNLPAPMTIAILPYAKRAKDFAKMAKDRGHEIIVHTPMEAMDSKVPLGDLALKSSYSEERFNQEMDKILASFDGYTGLNNHMGSRLTQDKVAMSRLMSRLKDEGLFFVDSRTIHTSVAAKIAKEHGLPYAVRDVFLDHNETTEFVENALKNVERIARERGSVIAIGHPKGVTMAALEAWVLGAQNRGFEFVPVSALLKKPAQVFMANAKNESANEEAIPALYNPTDLMAPSLSEIAPASGRSQLPEQLPGLY